MKTIIEIIENRKNEKTVQIVNGRAYYSPMRSMECSFNINDRVYYSMDGEVIAREESKKMKKAGIPFIMATSKGDNETRVAFM